jgi:hypothetical protein
MGQELLGNTLGNFEDATLVLLPLLQAKGKWGHYIHSTFYVVPENSKSTKAVFYCTFNLNSNLSVEIEIDHSSLVSRLQPQTKVYVAKL